MTSKHTEQCIHTLKTTINKINSTMKGQELKDAGFRVFKSTIYMIKDTEYGEVLYNEEKDQILLIDTKEKIEHGLAWIDVKLLKKEAKKLF